MYQFGNGLIKCLKCNNKFIGKSQRTKKVYVCSTYNKLGNQKCERFVIEEEFLIYAITKHVELTGSKVEKPLEEYIKTIEVNNDGFRIFYKDKTEAIFESDRAKF